MYNRNPGGSNQHRHVGKFFCKSTCSSISPQPKLITQCLLRGTLKLPPTTTYWQQQNCTTVRGHPSISLLPPSSPTLPLFICTSPIPLYHLQGPHSKANNFCTHNPMTFQKSTHWMSSTSHIPCKGTSVRFLTSSLLSYSPPVYMYSLSSPLYHLQGLHRQLTTSIPTARRLLFRRPDDFYPDGPTTSIPTAQLILSRRPDTYSWRLLSRRPDKFYPDGPTTSIPMARWLPRRRPTGSWRLLSPLTTQTWMAPHES
jgi:hypothetical protein